MNRTWQATLCAIVIGVAAPFFANAADVNIQPQPLSSALQDLAKQSGVQIIFFSKAVEGHRAPALSGEYRPEDAVDRLLEGTGLTYHVLNDRAIEVAARPVASAPSQPKPALHPPGSPSALGGTRSQPGPLDEVEVIAERERLSAMRAELQRLEQQFYAEYNERNTDPQYDILCAAEARHGARVTDRICQPAFVKAARDAAGRAGDRCAPPAIMVVLAKTPAHQKNMSAVVTRHPELVELLKERYELAQRYEALRTGKADGGGPPFRANGSNGVARAADVKRPTTSSLAPLTASALTGCTSQDLSIEKLPTEEWAIAKGLEPVEIDGKRHLCIPQPGVAEPIRNRATCITLADLRRARAARPITIIKGFEYPIPPMSDGGLNMNPLYQP